MAILPLTSTYDPQTDRLRDHLAIKALVVLLLLATILVVIEMRLIDGWVSSIVNDFFRHVMDTGKVPAPAPH